MANHQVPPNPRVTRRRKLIGVGAFVATLALWIAAFVVITPSAAQTSGPRSVSAPTSCTTDATGRCTVAHGLGAVPDAIIVSPNTPGNFNAYILNTVQGSYTATTFTVRAMFNQTTPKANGTIWFTYFASVGMKPPPPPPPSTTTTAPPPPPTTTTPVTTTPVTTTPSTSTTVPSTTATSTPPTTTTTPPPNNTCTNPTKINEQDGRTFAAPGTSGGQYYVHNDAWNWQGNNNGQYEKLYLCNYNSWYVDSWGFHTPEGEVFMYPSTKWDATTNGCCTGKPLSTWPNTFAGRFSGATNAVWDTGSYNVAWDMWLNGVADASSTELMVWTQRHGNATPAGSRRTTYTAPDGKIYDVWWDGAQRGGCVSFVSQTTQFSGTVDLRAMILFTQSKAFMPSGTPTVNQVNYGVEVRDSGTATETAPARFTLYDYALTMN